MKKFSLIISSIIIVFLISSCGGPKADVKKMMKLHKEYSEVGTKAAEDRVLDDKEIEELNEIAAEIEDFESKREEKYKTDTTLIKEYETYLGEEENVKIMNDYISTVMVLYSCEGAEKLK